MSKKNEIERAAIELFSKKGIKATTVKDIAKAAQITEGAIYKHFSSKDELAQAVFEEKYNEIIDDLKNISAEHGTLDDVVKQMIGYYCTKFDEEPEIFTYLLISDHYQYNLSPRFTLIDFIVDILKKYKVDGDRKFIANILLGAVIETGRNILHKKIDGKMSDHKKKIITSCLVILENSAKIK